MCALLAALQNLNSRRRRSHGDRLTSPSGRWLQFTYDTCNRIQQIADNMGRFVSYSYDSSSCTGNMLGRLKTFTDLNSKTTTYNYQGIPQVGALVATPYNVLAGAFYAETAILGGALIVDAASALPVMNVAGGVGHVAFGVDGAWLHATGDFFDMEITSDQAAAFARYTQMTGGYQFSLPVLNPGAVLATEGEVASTCITAACYAFIQGWLP